MIQAIAAEVLHPAGDLLCGWLVGSAHEAEVAVARLRAACPGLRLGIAAHCIPAGDGALRFWSIVAEVSDSGHELPASVHGVDETGQISGKRLAKTCQKDQ